MKDGNPWYYAILPAPIRYAEDLSEFQKILYAEVTALADKYGYCFASNSYFGNLYKKSTAWISKNINNMTKLGYLKLEHDIAGWNQRKIFIWELTKITSSLKVPIKQKCNRGIVEKDKRAIVEKCKTPIAENFNHNNTSINTTSVNEEKAPTTHKNIEYINWMRDVEIRWSHWIKKWNETTWREDIMNDEIKKAMYALMKNVTFDIFEQRVSKYVAVVSIIEDKKLKNYIFYPIWEYDFLQFLSKINQFYWESPIILSKIAKIEFKTKIVGMIREQNTQKIEEPKKIQLDEETRKKMNADFKEKMRKLAQKKTI